jgi:hypothetical protein
MAAGLMINPPVAPPPAKKPPQGPIQVGPTPQQVTEVGGTYNYSRNTPNFPGEDPNGPDTYSLPLVKKPSAQQQFNQDRLMNALTGIGDSSSSFSSGGSVDTPPREIMAPVPTGPDNTASQNASFAAAKAKAGAMGRSALGSLRAELAERGILGSGVEGRGLVDRLAAATNPLSDINVAQLDENVKIGQHNQDLGADAAKAQFAGNIAQRGQDVSAAEAEANRKQQAQAQQYALLTRALGALGGGQVY